MINPDSKITATFTGQVARKVPEKTVKGNAPVPAYVPEYLSVQYCATDDEDTCLSCIALVRFLSRYASVEVA